jgi:hypothetical protein
MTAAMGAASPLDRKNSLKRGVKKAAKAAF